MNASYSRYTIIHTTSPQIEQPIRVKNTMSPTDSDPMSGDYSARNVGGKLGVKEVVFVTFYLSDTNPYFLYGNTLSLGYITQPYLLTQPFHRCLNVLSKT